MPAPVPSAPRFGKFRNVFWPIHAYELKKLVPMLVMFFFISLVYSLLRNTKDTLIVTAPGGGAELIPFLKVYAVIPASVLFAFGYVKLSNHVSRFSLFILSVLPFLAYFSAFLFLYQIRESIEPAGAALRMKGHLPPGLMHFVAMFRHWVLSSFYVMSELWGSIALSLLFWGFANHITRVEEAKRFYGLFGLGANLALVAVKGVNGCIHGLQGRMAGALNLDPWTAYLAILMGVVLLSMGIILGLYVFINRRVMTDPRFRDGGAPPAPRAKATFREGVATLWRNPVLRGLAILVIAYGLSINLIEVTWKSYLGLRFPDPGAYQDYMVNFSMATGFTTLFMMLFVSSNVIRAFGWTTAALVTPGVLLATGAGFFGFILGQGALAPWLERLALAPLGVGVLFGTIQNVLSKAAKYSLFDPTKEMAYIPLDLDAKVKGKAAIDVVGARVGKAAGSMLQQLLIALYGSLRAVTGQIALLLLGIIGLWIWTDLRLGRDFARMTGRRQASE